MQEKGTDGGGPLWRGGDAITAGAAHILLVQFRSLRPLSKATMEICCVLYQSGSGLYWVLPSTCRWAAAAQAGPAREPRGEAGEVPAEHFHLVRDVQSLHC